MFLTPETEDDVSFTPDELIDCLNTMSPNRAPGVDNLTSDICLKFTQKYTAFLTSVMNRCLEIGHFPTPWKLACVKILPKPNKTDYTDLASFRPIGLLPIFGKVLEKLFIRRLTFNAQTTKSWSERQFGFREQTSTTDALHNAIDFIKESKDQCIGVSLDIKAAFDNAWWPALLERLRKTGCPKNIFKLITSYIEERQVTLNYGDASSVKSMTKGCVQGSVCGPTFWNIILDELLETPLPEGCYIQAFADDVLLLVRAEDATSIEQKTNEALKIIQEWGVGVKLVFSPAKTQAIYFTPASQGVVIRMNNDIISFEPNIKLLGVIIDSNLNFIAHVKHIIAKASKIFKNLCKFVRPTWGVHAENVTTIYRQVVEPTITYAAGVWGDAAKRQSCIKILRSFQRGFALRAIKAFHTVSAVSALSLAQFMPLHLKIREVQEIEIVKRTGVCPTIPEDIELERRIKPSERLHPSMRRYFDYSLATTQQEADALASQTNIFTDGSKLDTREVGASVVIRQTNSRVITKKYRLNKSCSVFQAELMALTQALIWCETNLKTNATLYTDSRSSLDAINIPTNSHPLVASIHKSLNAISKRHDIRLVWVKAHIGIVGNEEADAAAKEAATKHSASAYNSFPITFAKNIIRQNMFNEWALEYRTAPQGSGTKFWFKELKDAKDFVENSEASFEMTQILTNHGYHKEYLERFRICSDTHCPCDAKSTQSIEHLLKRCPRYAQQRDEYERLCLSISATPYNLASNNAEHLAFFGVYVKEIINSLKTFNKT